MPLSPFRKRLRVWALLVVAFSACGFARRHHHAAPAAEPKAAPAAEVTVKAGDTLYSLSGKAHASVDEVAKLNRIRAPYALHLGQVLKLPVPKTYVARKGDSVEAVADRFGVRESQLRKANPDLADADKLKRGAKLTLPAAAKDGGAGDGASGAGPKTAVSKAAADDDDLTPKERRRKAREAKAEALAQAKAGKAPADDETLTPRERRRKAREAKAEALAEAKADRAKGAKLRTTKAEPERDAEDIVADAALPPARSTRASRRAARVADAKAAATPVVTPPEPEPTVATREPLKRETPQRDSTAEASPGPRPYASVFGTGSTTKSSRRPGRDRSGRTAQDAQGAVDASVKRDVARGSITPLATLLADGGSSGGGATRPRFAWPVAGQVLDGFGPKGGGLRNDGLDLAAQVGDAVKASAAGEVVYAGGAIPGFGNLVLVKHPGGWVTAYGHLSKISVAMRQAVRQGDLVGEAGQTGAALRPELHFEIRFAATPEESARPVDPMPLLPRRG